MPTYAEITTHSLTSGDTRIDVNLNDLKDQFGYDETNFWGSEIVNVSRVWDKSGQTVVAIEVVLSWKRTHYLTMTPDGSNHYIPVQTVNGSAPADNTALHSLIKAFRD